MKKRDRGKYLEGEGRVAYSVSISAVELVAGGQDGAWAAKDAGKLYVL